MGKKTAIIYFSRTAKKEAQSKHWFKSSIKKNQYLANKLISDTYTYLQSLDFPVFLYNEHNQTGNTFGEKLANAYQDVFDLGYDSVISVGNDTPELHKINWQQATLDLANQHCVLGPSFNGGSYFIGITKIAFNKKHFANLPWQNKRLFNELLNFCDLNDEQKTVVIQQLHDINTLRDLLLLVKEGKAKKLIAFIRFLLLSIERVFFSLQEFFTTNEITLCKNLRGPPYSIS